MKKCQAAIRWRGNEADSTCHKEADFDVAGISFCYLHVSGAKKRYREVLDYRKRKINETKGR